MFRRILFAGFVSTVLGGCLVRDVVAVQDGAVGNDSAPYLQPIGPADCPPFSVAQAANLTSCSLPNGTVCGYQLNGSFIECSCGCRADHIWSCLAFGGTASTACPLIEPTNGGVCQYAAVCPYLPTSSSGGRARLCSCESSGVWRCVDDSEAPLPCQPASTDAGIPDAPVAHPGVDGTRRIADLTDAEATAWCTWFIATLHPGPLPPPGLPETTPGIADSYAFGSCGPPVSACISMVPIDVCAANLRLFPCQATVSQLDGCALTVDHACTLQGAGCGAFFAAANCSHTFVQQAPTDRCPVQYR